MIMLYYKETNSVLREIGRDAGHRHISSNGGRRR